MGRVRKGKGGGSEGGKGRMKGELQLVHIEHPNSLSESKNPGCGQDYACNHAVNDCSEETLQSVQAACLL